MIPLSRFAFTIRGVAGLTAALCLFLAVPRPATASTFDFLSDFDIGVGINRGTANDADETFAFGLKQRLTHWEYGLDLCMSEDRGGIGDNNFAFAWGSWIDEFHRRDWQDYGIYAGAGAGVLIFQDELVDWPAGPFVLLGWDFSPQAGLEGKLGYFGENYWGTAMLYWYFE